MGFAPGRLVLRRHFIRAQVARVWVGTAVRDDDRGSLLWIADGSAFRDLVTVDGQTPRDIPFEEWLAAPKRLDERPWAGDALMWHPRAGAYSIWFWFGAGGAFQGWYANLEVPAVPWRDGVAAGLDTVDWDLDVVIAPDRSWRWKDEHDFRSRLPFGDRYWVDDEATVRAAGAEVVKLAEAGEFPFDGTWCDFRPDPSWPVPVELPSGWDRPRAW